jgi:hypothetical protein
MDRASRLLDEALAARLPPGTAAALADVPAPMACRSTATAGRPWPSGPARARSAAAAGCCRGALGTSGETTLAQRLQASRRCLDCA